MRNWPEGMLFVLALIIFMLTSLFWREGTVERKIK